MDARREDPQLLAEVVRQSADPVFFIRTDGTIGFWNRGAQLLLGWTSAEVIGENAEVILPSIVDYRQEPPQNPTVSHEDIVIQNHRTTLLSKSGVELPVRVTITLVRDGDGNIIGSSVTARDAIDERDLENERGWRMKELELLEKVTHAVQDSLDLHRILLVILTSVTAGTGAGFNRAFLFLKSDDQLRCRLAIGVSDSDEADRVWPRVAHLPDLGAVLEYVLNEEQAVSAKATRIGTDWSVPLDTDRDVLIQCLRDMQPLVWPFHGHGGQAVAKMLGVHSFAVVPLVHAGEAYGVILADNAVTNRPIDEHAVRLLSLLANEASYAIVNARLYERMLLHATNLESANAEITRQQQLVLRTRRKAALSEIAASLSHELRGPISSIGGLARALLKDSDPSAASMLSLIADESQRVERIVSQVVAISELPTPVLRPVDIAELTSNVYTLYRAEAEARHIALALNMPDEPPNLSVDGDQWHQLVQNLVENALAVAPTGTTITTSAEVLDGGRFQLTVRDEGPGLEQKDVPRVFGSLFSTKPSGQGLGLAIIARVVQNHHGNVTVESEPGTGTCVRVSVPSPDELTRLVEEDRRSGADAEEPNELDPLTIATFNPT
jgi:PAS domain S-box-containing protein